jgi:hypothetical protein
MHSVTTAPAEQRAEISNYDVVRHWFNAAADRLELPDDLRSVLLSAYREVLPILSKAVDAKDVRSALRGEPLEPVFRKTSNFNTKPVRRAP